MANIGEQFLNVASDVGYNTRITWNDEIKMEKGWWNAKMIIEILGTITVVLLLFAAIVMMATLTTKLNNTLMFGNRSQKLCGQNYMEYESARNKLYNEYDSPGTTKKIKNIKQLLSVSLILITIVLILTLLITFHGRNSTLDWKNGQILYFWIFAILLTVFLITFFVVNKKAVLENTYGNSKTEKKMTPLLIVMLILIVLTCIINIVVVNPIINDKTSTLFVLMIAAILTIAFMFIINIRTKEIEDNFISKYDKYSKEINKSICNLGQNDSGTIPEGTNKGMKIHKWIKQLLSRNYKRLFQNEEDGDIDIHFGDKMDCADDKFKMNYVYLEHNHGKELDELPDDTKKIRNDQNIIRENMWKMRNENNKMLKPVKQFVNQMRIFVLVILFILMFIVYHVAYINYPGYTKLTLVAVVLIFTFVLMYSVIV